MLHAYTTTTTDSILFSPFEPGEENVEFFSAHYPAFADCAILNELLDYEILPYCQENLELIKEITTDIECAAYVFRNYEHSYIFIQDDYVETIFSVYDREEEAIKAAEDYVKEFVDNFNSSPEI